ncbi:MAG: OmpA family protein [Bacteroidetes bacterium]|nr:OmpA family protein [Bacteroidota bacterium]
MILHYIRHIFIYHLVVALCLCIPAGLFAQKKKADKLYDKLEYYKALPKYVKASKKGDGPEKQESLIRLADCYRMLKDYNHAEEYYKQAVSLGTVTPEVHYNYGNVLKTNTNYTEALNQYTKYLASKPFDKKAEYAVKSCKEIKYWQSKPQEYQVEQVNGVNTKYAEFCPVMVNNRLVYAGEKQSDIVDFPTSDMNGKPYLNVYYVNAKAMHAKPKVLSRKVNTSFHDGPVAFSADGNTMFITRVNYIVNKKNKDFVNRGKLYISTGHDTHWSKPQPFQYNSDDYSCAHASLSADGNYLFFTSDMPGGQGGKDIWVCRKNAGGWDKPVNLGPDVNTSGDEMFPCIRKDGLLFYSSDGLPGFGGLDIFTARQLNDKWVMRRNEGLFLNSSADDFGISFVSDSTGYFSSNREGGKGADDIYAFKFTNKYITVSGTILLTDNTNDPAKDVKVYLLDSNSQKIDSTKTNDAGYFEFKNLEADKTYMAQVDDSDAQLKNKARFYMADKNNKVARVTHTTDTKQKFVFKNLPIDPNSMPDLYDEEDLSLAGNLLVGENPSKPLANKKVMIKNAYGDVVEETTTNEFGAFAFRNLPTDQNYTLYIDDSEVPADAKIILTNKTGKEVKVADSDSRGQFQFNLLSVDKEALKDLSVVDDDLVMTLNGYIYDQDRKALANAKVVILDGQTAVQNIMTDVTGKFQFKNLVATKNYMFIIEDPENKFTNVTKIFVADARGRIYKEIKRGGEGRFQFNLLAIDKDALGDYTVDDPWLQVLEMKNKQRQESLTIIENLYYAYGDWHIDASGTKILDKVITVLNSNPNLTIELSSHTDSRSSDQYNLQLSQKRAKAAVDYMISRGIDKNRLKAIGYGESKLLNNCKNGVECSEEEHARNRRTEFKIVELPKG